MKKRWSMTINNYGEIYKFTSKKKYTAWLGECINANCFFSPGIYLAKYLGDINLTTTDLDIDYAHEQLEQLKK